MSALPVRMCGTRAARAQGVDCERAKRTRSDQGHTPLGLGDAAAAVELGHAPARCGRSLRPHSRPGVATVTGMDEIRPWADVLADAGVEFMPPAAKAMKVIADQWWARHSARAESVIQDVLERTGPDRLGSAMMRDPLVEAVFLDGVDAGARTGLDAKRRLLAMVISEAVLDDARVDESLLYVQALRDLDAPHLRALERIARAEEAAALAPEEAWGQQWDGEHVFKDEPHPIRAALVRTGCATNPPTTRVIDKSVRVYHATTPFGRGLLAHIREYDDAGQITAG